MAIFTALFPRACARGKELSLAGGVWPARLGKSWVALLKTLLPLKQEFPLKSEDVITPRASARGKAIGSIVVIVVTKIAKSGDLAT